MVVQRKGAHSLSSQLPRKVFNPFSFERGPAPVLSTGPLSDVGLTLLLSFTITLTCNISWKEEHLVAKEPAETILKRSRKTFPWNRSPSSDFSNDYYPIC